MADDEFDDLAGDANELPGAVPEGDDEFDDDDDDKSESSFSDLMKTRMIATLA